MQLFFITLLIFFNIKNLIYYIFFHIFHIFQATAKLKMPAFLSSEAKNADYLGKW